MHVHKTGGAALTGVLANRFAARDCLELYFGPEADLSDLDRFRYVSGHVHASFIERFAQAPFVLTVLRDPIDRALSSYSYTRSLPVQFELPPVQLLGRGARPLELAREWYRLTSECELGELISRAPEVAREYLGNRQARALGASEAGEERLPDALEGLERCDFVGLTERLDESVDWLTRRLGWQDIRPLPRANVTGPRLRRDQVPADTMEALARLTLIDQELYRRGVGIYERQLEEWRAMPDPRDPSARIPDASPAGDLRFDQAMLGGGWMNRERAEDGSTFCWIGDTRRAWLEMTAESEAGSLIIEIPHVIDQEVLGGLRISVGGRAVPHTLAESDGVVVASAPVPPGSDSIPRRRVEIEVGLSRHPCDVNPESVDNRELAIAVRRVALRPA
jgi:hypothetical protein